MYELYIKTDSDDDMWSFVGLFMNAYRAAERGDVLIHTGVTWKWMTIERSVSQHDIRFSTESER